MQRTKTERTPQGLQFILPGAERKTAPGVIHSEDAGGQLLLGELAPVTDEERLRHREKAPLAPRRGQKPLPADGLFRRG